MMKSSSMTQLQLVQKLIATRNKITLRVTVQSSSAQWKHDVVRKKKICSAPKHPTVQSHRSHAPGISRQANVAQILWFPIWPQINGCRSGLP